MRAVFLGMLLALGAAIFGTISHQSEQAGVAVGLILALGAVALAAVTARSLGPIARILFLITFLALIFAFSQDFTGDKLIPQNLAGQIWSYGSALLAAMAALWPRVR